jgi:TatA/E family protein of Tat protein translocase
MGSMSIVHWMIVVAVAVLLFGKVKISDLMGDVAQGIKSFKKGMQDDGPETENVAGADGAHDRLHAKAVVPSPIPAEHRTSSN